MSRHLKRASSIEDLRHVARCRLPRVIFDSVDGGAEDEVTLRANRAAFGRVGFLPHTLEDVSVRSQGVELFGHRVKSPLVVAPMGLLGLLHPRAEIALARAAASAGVPFILATGANTSIERLADEAGSCRRWFQLYPFRDETINRSLLGRAEAAGYEALVVTTDTQIAPNRERDRRNGFSLDWKPGLRLALDVARRPGWCWRMLASGGMPRFETLTAEMEGTPDARATASFFLARRDWNPTWETIALLRRQWRGPLVIKGLLTVAEALRAADLGADGIVLSNHGGRNLDGALSPIAVLPEVADAVGQRLTVLVDSGFRRGADVVKALALGARAVLVGRAMAWGVAAGGEEGASRALGILYEEIDRVLAFLGCARAADLAPAFIRRIDEARWPASDRVDGAIS
jgi:(S)-mandelate dehydrogenase